MDALTRAQWDWADKYQPQIESILRSYGGHLLSVTVADEYRDTQEATDLVLSVSGNITVALRVRYLGNLGDTRDWTVRAKSKNGGRTEIHKLRSGFADWYLYAWADDQYIREWMMIDLCAVRDSGILSWRHQVIPNKDKTTAFIYIPAVALDNKGLIPACYIPTANLVRTSIDWKPPPQLG